MTGHRPMLSAMSQPSPVEWAALTDDDLVTGEAVALDLPPAGLALRMGSGMIDVLVTLVLLLVVALTLLLATLRTDEALMGAAFVAITVVTFVAVPTAVETLTRGRSVGKLALGLRTVRDDGAPITFQQAFVRALVGYVEIYMFSGVPAFFSSLLTERGKRLGDHAAGTYVVRDRVSLELRPPVQMPPQLQAWAARADIAPLPTGLALRVRQLLMRVHDIAPHARAMLADRLAAEVSRYVAPPPPPGTPPEAFLAAVIAERRERDGLRLRREAGLRTRLLGRR